MLVESVQPLKAYEGIDDDHYRKSDEHCVAEEHLLGDRESRKEPVGYQPSEQDG